MIVDVCETSTAWDVSLKQIGDAFQQRLQVPAAGIPSNQSDHLASAQADITVRVAALGLSDARCAEVVKEDRTTDVVSVWLTGPSALVGLFTPAARVPNDAPRPPCPACVEWRWQAIRPREERHTLEHGGQARVSAPLPYLTPFAIEALWRLVEQVRRQEPTGVGIVRLYQLRLDTLDVVTVDAIADSECPACSMPRPDTAQDAVVTLDSRAKPTTTSYRLRPAKELDLPVSALANPVVGALGPNALRVYNANTTAPVSGYFRVRSRFDLHEMWWSGHANSYGRSETYALLEGLERYAGQYARAKRVDVFDSYAQLKDQALDPSGCGYHPDFYAGHGLYYAPFDPQEPLRWVWGYSLRDREPRLVPEQMVYYLDRRTDQRKFVQECSNGCASGSCPEEALLHAMLELVERDAFLLAWYGAARLAEIDPATCRDEQVHIMLDRVNLLGYDVRLFDTRADLPIPVVTAVAVRRDGGLGRLCFAAGASFDPDDAVRAALCETASYVPGFDERVADKEPELRAMVEDYTKVAELSHHALLYGLPEMATYADFLFDNPPVRSMQELYADWLEVRPDTLDLRDDVEYLARVIAELGGDVVAVDQTCPEQQVAGVCTMAVVAPALIPIDFGWQRQRVLHSDRLAAYIARGRHGPDGLGATRLNLHPHPFP